MKTLVKLIALFILIIASLIIPHKGFTKSLEESKVNEPQDMARLEMIDALNEAYSETFETTQIEDVIVGAEIMIFDFMDNLILDGNQKDNLTKSILRCCDFLTEVSGTKMYKMNVERPIYKECRELLNLK